MLASFRVEVYAERTFVSARAFKEEGLVCKDITTLPVDWLASSSSSEEVCQVLAQEATILMCLAHALA